MIINILRANPDCACTGAAILDCTCLRPLTVDAMDEGLMADEVARLPKAEREAVLDLRCEEIEIGEIGWRFVDAETIDVGTSARRARSACARSSRLRTTSSTPSTRASSRRTRPSWRSAI